MKKFLEVFPALVLEDEVRLYIADAEVTKVTSTPSKDKICVYLESKRWIHKKHIRALEREIKGQLFRDLSIDIHILERFHLSDQYKPETFLQVYRDSLLQELQEYNAVLFHLYREARVAFPEPTSVVISLADTVISRRYGDELCRILDKVLCERASFKVEVTLLFKKAETSRAMREAKAKIEQELSHMADELVRGGDPGEITGGEAPAFMDAKEGGQDPFMEPASLGKGDGSLPGKRREKAKTSVSQTKDSKGEYYPRKSAKGNRTGRRGGVSRQPDPGMLLGRDFEEEAVTIDSLSGEMGETVIKGKILKVDSREIRNEKTIMILYLTDFTDTIAVKIFLANEVFAGLSQDLKPGTFIKLKGLASVDAFDHELTIGNVSGLKKIRDFTSVRMDSSREKRVELHCHTKMSDMDGVSDVKDLVKRAYAWGHPAIAITDHGGVQAFPDANHAMEDIDNDYRSAYAKDHPELDKKELKKISAPFKVIYGVEAYLVDDLKGIVDNSKGQSLEGNFVVFDLETTGLSPESCQIIEIGAVRVEGGKMVDRFSTFVNPQVPIPFKIENLTGINDNMVIDAPLIKDVMPDFIEFCRDAVLVAHNSSFDMSFINKNCIGLGHEVDFTSVDTVGMARALLPGLNRFKLDTLAKALNIRLDNHHRAVDDAACTAEIFVKFLSMLGDREIRDLDQLNSWAAISKDTIKKLPTNHAIILATGEVGRVNLYRLISKSHLEYYNRRPRVPKSVFQEHREGLLIGTACEAGELYQALLRGASDAEITRLVEFYDYLEIQPLGNNAFMMKKEEAKTEEDLRELNRKIVKLGDQFGKPVVATCDVHFMDPQDEIYRRIIMVGKGFADGDDQPPLYFRTTEEMLEEFSYLGPEKAREVVIQNPRMIAEKVDKISPIRAGKFPPVIEDSDKTLRQICYNKAHELYGEDLPAIVKERLDRELNSIISNGYAVMYIIAQKLVWKSNEDGYLVGSRGSVGSSFVATMSGITEVNPLPPHYLCPSCHYSDFTSEEVKSYGGKSGCDMPDKDCPVCGSPLRKEGFDIPFETFLGFKGNKEPDIDLNFSGDYQGKAHKYTEVIFGADQTFRAGTIGTLAAKTAFGYVKNYFEEHGISKRNCEIDRIVEGCTGIRRTTGQHPGGIIVLPIGEDINAFTPVQHPANDVNTDIVTTHFDYHSIDENLLKLDILGHDDPTMIRMLEDLTGLDAQKIPLDNPDVMMLFKGTERLGVKPEDIRCPLGCLGVPEFGTDFVIQMLQDTNPQSISDLIRISGLSHGTDVWLGNAQTLIQEKKATISTAICTRDDIMIYLIQKGVESELAFTIMESVRKGKGLKPEWEEEMLSHDVPDWYIWSCKKIKYMFPKAHAAAYVMMAYRIAYYKIFYPLAYYAAYFSIRASAFSYELMCLGRERLEYYFTDLENREGKLTKKDEDTVKDMKLVREMYARGFTFAPIDIYKAKAHHFQIIDGKLMPSLDSIEGLGDKAAEAIVLAAREGKFLSKDDFRVRTKVSKTTIDLMVDLGILKDLPETNQISIFDF